VAIREPTGHAPHLANTAYVNERAQRLENRLEPWYLVAALLVIPDVCDRG
jgi:hypothetical protein